MATFLRGQQIEVASNEDGFVGSYFEAKIITKLLTSEYIVEYKTLMKDDFSAPLKEVVTAAEIRPTPPVVAIPENGFNTYDRVDAYDNDGWWVGTVSRPMGSEYLVYFSGSRAEIKYSVDQLRVHQDWVDDEWVTSLFGRD